MNMTGNHGVFRNIMMMAAGLNVVLTLWLTPCYGMNGAAVSAMTSLCFWNMATLAYIKMKFGRTTGYFPLPAWL